MAFFYFLTLLGPQAGLAFIYIWKLEVVGLRRSPTTSNFHMMGLWGSYSNFHMMSL